MSTKPYCHLTTNDLTVLEDLDSANHGDAFLLLLRRKLSTARIVFREDLADDVARIGSRIDFAIDKRSFRDWTLGDNDEAISRKGILPVTTLQGLALLGLKAGDEIVVGLSDGRTETIRLDMVHRETSADRRTSTSPDRRSPGVSFKVVSLTERRGPARRLDTAPIDREDDPGPSAA